MFSIKSAGLLSTLLGGNLSVAERPNMFGHIAALAEPLRMTRRLIVVKVLSKKRFMALVLGYNLLLVLKRKHFYKLVFSVW